MSIIVLQRTRPARRLLTIPVSRPAGRSAELGRWVLSSADGQVCIKE